VQTHLLNSAGGPPSAGDAATDAVTGLYQAHATGMIRLAMIMLGDRPASEDVVQDAFCGLYRRWRHLHDPAKALEYVRTAVFNGCRSQLRARTRAQRRARAPSARPDASAEESALLAEEHKQVLAALRGRQVRRHDAEPARKP
jgi:RNA polymerase sigma factor (sigma-70 family)